MAYKALVIGSEGNIGKPLVSHLRHLEYDVKEIDIKAGWRDNYQMADINEPVDLLSFFDWKPDVVFLLAAVVSRVTCESSPGLAITTNLGGVNNVLQLSKRVGAKVVYFSTSEVYGPECDPMDESISDPKPNNRYGLSKLLGEKLVEYEVRQYGLKAVSLRPFMIYDENETIGDHRSAMIRFAVNLLRGRPIQVHRGATRGWLHISDAVRAIEKAAHVEDYAAINIGHPEVVPIEDLAEMIRQETGAARALIESNEIPGRMTLIKRPVLDRQKNLLGVVPEVALRDGVKRVCARVKERLAEY